MYYVHVYAYGIVCMHCIFICMYIIMVCFTSSYC